MSKATSEQTMFHTQDLSVNNVLYKTFTFFPRLPPEIRNKIWCLALPRLRLVTLSYAMDGPSRDGSHRAKLETEVPALLGTCQESQALALSYYTPQLSSHLEGN